MDGFTDRLDDLYLSFSSLDSREQREKAVDALSKALQRMSATIETPSDFLAEEATRIIAAEYGGWNDRPSTSYDPRLVDSIPYDAADGMNEYEEALREERGGGKSLMSYWKEQGEYEMDTMTPSTVADVSTEDKNKKRMWEEEVEGASEKKKRKISSSSPIYEEAGETATESISCVVCGVMEDSFEAYLAHMQSHHQVEREEEYEEWIEEEEEGEEEEKRKEWKCCECGMVARTRKTMWRHGRTTGHDWSRKGGEHSCDKCDYTTTSKFNLERHSTRNHPELRDVECPVCGWILPSLPSFLSHHESAHREISQSFQCELCKKHFAKKGKLMRHHKAVHECLRPFSCSSCLKSFPSGWHLRRHQKVCMQ